MMRSHHAEYNTHLTGVSSTRQACMKGTCEAIKDLLLDWAADQDSESVYWLNGMAGTGKTTISYTFCDALASEAQSSAAVLGASFFCYRELEDCRQSRFIIPTIAFQLARCSRTFAFHLVEALVQNPAAPEMIFAKQFHDLLETPWKVAKDTFAPTPIIIIDALDECEDGTAFLEQLLKAMQSNCLPGLKFFITSRPEQAIVDIFPPSSSPLFTFLRLQDINHTTIHEDIKLYISTRLSGVAAQSHIDKLVESSGELFIYAATAVNYILQAAPNADLNSRIAIVLKHSKEVSKNSTKPLDDLYSTILQGAAVNLDDGEIHRFQHVLDTLVGTREPLSIQTMSGLLGINAHQVQRVVVSLQSIYRMINDSDPILPLHASFSDYMKDSSRSSKEVYNRVLKHNDLLMEHCFAVMRKELKFNICELESSFTADDKVPDMEQRKNTKISRHLRYSCQSWAYHLCKSDTMDSRLFVYFEDFISTRLLFWIEVMNLIGEVNQCAYMLIEGKKWFKVHFYFIILGGLLI